MSRPISITPALILALAFASCTDEGGPVAPGAPVGDLVAAATLTQSTSLQLRAISNAIDELFSAGSPNPGVAQSLRARVKTATTLFDAGKVKQGRAVLSSLLLQLRALVSGGVLQADQVAPLLAALSNAVAGGLSLVSITSGEYHACGLSVDGQAWCWGYNLYGQLGDGSMTNRSVPAPVATDLRFTSLSAGGLHTCGLTSDGTAYCWGRGDLGELGNGARESSALPVRVTGTASWTEVDLAWPLSCALQTDGSAFCWGSNQYGALGTSAVGESCTLSTSSIPCSSTPVAVSGHNTFRSLSVGLVSSCGLDAAGTAHCWGWGAFGELGDGVKSGCETDVGTRCAAMPTAVLGGPFTSISAGGAFACGLTTANAAQCWGVGSFGQLGNGTRTGSYVPTSVAGDLSFRVVKATKANSILGHACGLTTSGQAFCWGSNAYGQLGATSAPDICPFSNLSPACSLTPIAVAGDIAFSAISPGNGSTCALDVGRGVWCWGWNVVGQLGDGTTLSRPTPTRVIAP